MGTRNLLTRLRLVKACSILLGFCFFLASSSIYATAGCCSKHGGVVGCNKSTNHLLCKDRSASPSCLCEGGITKAVAPVEKTRATSSKPSRLEEITKKTKEIFYGVGATKPEHKATKTEAVKKTKADTHVTKVSKKTVSKEKSANKGTVTKAQVVKSKAKETKAKVQKSGHKDKGNTNKM